MKSLITWLFFLALLLLTACSAWWVFAPHGAGSDTSSRIEIQSGDGAGAIARKLQQATGLSAQAFRWLTQLSGQSQNLRAGVYEIQTGDSPWRILDKMVRGESRLDKLTIIEGWTFAQMRVAVETHPGIRATLQGLDDAAHWQSLKLPALLPTASPPAELPSALRTQFHPEGLFFPDTYWFAQGTTDVELYRIAYEAMQRELQRAWEARAPNLPLRTPYQALILASIIEKETGMASDRGKIAGVFVNRLNLGMRLQTDPTVIYGLGDQFDGNLRRRDLETDTPYNTYTRTGLPPTPIALPGRASLRAAVNPEPTQALYFVSRGDGTSHFSHRLTKHNQAVDRYQRGQ